MYSKTCVEQSLKNRQNKDLNDKWHLMKVKSIAERSPWSIVQYFWFALSDNGYSCIDVYSYSCLHPLSNERKSIFKSGDSRAIWTWVWTWKYLKWALHYLHDVIYRKRWEPDWSFRWCFCSRKHCVWSWLCDNVMTFESTQAMPFCLEKSSVRKCTI